MRTRLEIVGVATAVGLGVGAATAGSFGVLLGLYSSFSAGANPVQVLFYGWLGGGWLAAYLAEWGAPAGMLAGAVAGVVLALWNGRGRVTVMAWWVGLVAAGAVVLEGVALSDAWGVPGLQWPFLAAAPIALFASRYLVPRLTVLDDIMVDSDTDKPVGLASCRAGRAFMRVVSTAGPFRGR
jgi:hypothetical protein